MRILIVDGKTKHSSFAPSSHTLPSPYNLSHLLCSPMLSFSRFSSVQGLFILVTDDCQSCQSFLTDRTQSVVFNGQTSSLQTIMWGVPQGSVLGPLLFVLYSAEVFFHITTKHGVSIHAYADDLQTYTSCTASDQHIVSSRLLSCVADISTWMSSNRLKLNADKTEFIWLIWDRGTTREDQQNPIPRCWSGCYAGRQCS